MNQLLDSVFDCTVGPKLKAEADNPYLDLDYSGYHKNRSNNFLMYVKSPSQSTTMTM